VPLYVATVEDVILAKLEWAKLSESERQVEDVAAILKCRWGSLDHSYLDAWISKLNLNQQWNIAVSMSGMPKSD
jgi:hypothetical protein